MAERDCGMVSGGLMQPRWGCRGDSLRIAELRQSWAGGRNPVGVFVCSILTGVRNKVEIFVCSIPKGLQNTAQGREARATLGPRGLSSLTPMGLWPCRTKDDTTPSGLGFHYPSIPGLRGTSYPGIVKLVVPNPTGVVA